MNSTTFTNYTSAAVQKSFRSPQLKLSEILTLPIYGLIFITSVVGNLLVIITLVQNRRMWTVTNVFLLNLSVSDLLLAVFCMPFTIIPIMLKNFVFGEIVCVSIRYLQGVSVSVSCFTLVAISLERYFAICQPLHSRSWQTLKHSYKTILVCWIAAFCVCIPIAVFTKHNQTPFGNYMCREKWGNSTLHKAYTLFLDLVLLLAPILVMSISYGRICYTLWNGMKMDKKVFEEQNGNGAIYHKSTISTSKDGFGRSIGTSELKDLTNKRMRSSKIRFNARGIRQSNNEKSRVSKKRVIKMLFAVVLEYFICWAPLFVVQTWMTIDHAHAVQHISNLTHTSIFLLSYVSSCCNPITYCFINKNFREGFRSVFRCTRCKETIRARQEMPSYYHYSSSRTGVSHMSTYDKVNVKVDSDEL
ncbi:cholecystokinin receptor type A-like [Dreissena polymorpha]|nr:cholecystokinin receptor type A-like [Dreissena polymorpha]